MRERLKKLIPPPLRRGLRVLQAVPRYLARRVRPGGAMIPPPWKNFVGAGDFTGIGREFLRHFVDIGGLRPEDRVLDVGCGIGRMAIPLTGFLRPPGEYHGFDIVPGGIEWCRARITTRHPHFHFHHLDVRNRHYNPSGTMTAEAVRFPFDDGRFDFVFLTSVFTHMLPPALETYVREIARVLAPGGRCFLTAFLVDEEAEALMTAGRSTVPAGLVTPTFVAADPDDPEAAIAYREDHLRALLAAAGLTIREPIRRGSWCGRPHFLSYQDILVAAKP